MTVGSTYKEVLFAHVLEVKVEELLEDIRSSDLVRNSLPRSQSTSLLSLKITITINKKRPLTKICGLWSRLV